MPDELPAARRGDPAGMADAEVPGVRLVGDGQWADDRRGIPVHEGQRRHRVMRTARPATATRNAHDREIIVRKRPRGAGHAHSPGPGCPTVTIAEGAIRSAPRAAGTRGAKRPP